MRLVRDFFAAGTAPRTVASTMRFAELSMLLGLLIYSIEALYAARNSSTIALFSFMKSVLPTIQPIATGVSDISDQTEERSIATISEVSNEWKLYTIIVKNNFDGYVRPDHGRMIWGETGKPGYGLYDRALGATYINGLFEALEKELKK